VGPRAGLDTRIEEKSFALPGIEPRSPGLVRSQILYCLSYPAPSLECVAVIYHMRKYLGYGIAVWLVNQIIYFVMIVGFCLVLCYPLLTWTRSSVSNVLK
jgi:hypothetical protein